MRQLKIPHKESVISIVIDVYDIIIILMGWLIAATRYTYKKVLLLPQIKVS